MEDSVYLGLRVPRDMYDKLVELQKKDEDRSLSAIVRGILRQHLPPAKRKNGRVRR